MKFLFLIFYLIIFAARAQDSKPDLLDAREQGRLKSSFLNEKKVLKTLDNLDVPNIADFKKTIRPILEKNCLDCHGTKKAKGRFRVDLLNANLQKGDSAARWLEVYEVLSNSEMPPDDEPDYHLSNSDRNKVIEWLGEELYKAAQVKRNQKGNSSFRRMTKYEYNYALQDLLGVPFEFANELPPETPSEDGFKNSSEHLHISGLQFEVYRELALNALKKVTVKGQRPNPYYYDISMTKALSVANKRKAELLDKSAEGYSEQKKKTHLVDLNSGKGVVWDWAWQGGRWGFKPSDKRPENLQKSSLVAVLPHQKHMKIDLGNYLPDKGNMRVRIRIGKSKQRDNEHGKIRLLFGSRSSNSGMYWRRASREDILVTASAEKPQYIEYDIPLSEVPRNPYKNINKLGDNPNPAEVLHIENVSNTRRVKGQEDMVLVIDHVEVIAPFYRQWPPESHVNIFIEKRKEESEPDYFKRLLINFIERAWRRPVSSDEVERFAKLFNLLRSEYSTFEDAALEVLAASLATPQFLYLSQQEREASDQKLSDFDLANRLSFFLWSSIPDDELLKLAANYQLSDPKVLKEQTNRLMNDSRAQRFSKNFVHQWLGLEALENLTIDRKINRRFNYLKKHMLTEPVEYFREVLKENSSIIDFIHSDYAVINDRLASHYKIRGVSGSHFRKVKVDSNHRGGLLTTAGILSMNSDGVDSNPLKRGIWLLEKILHDPPPPPPPNVPEVDLADPEILKMTVKERLENHRNDPACRTCHAKIDPWGIAFENFDAVGLFRTAIDKKPVDASAHLFNKYELKGIQGLKQYLLLERQDQFAKAMVYKMTSYALGRSLSFDDHADIHEMTAKLRQQGDGLKDLIHIIVQSEIFQRF